MDGSYTSHHYFYCLVSNLAFSQNESGSNLAFSQNESGSNLSFSQNENDSASACL